MCTLLFRSYLSQMTWFRHTFSLHLSFYFTFIVTFLDSLLRCIYAGLFPVLFLGNFSLCYFCENDMRRAYGTGRGRLWDWEKCRKKHVKLKQQLVIAMACIDANNKTQDEGRKKINNNKKMLKTMVQSTVIWWKRNEVDERYVLNILRME